MATERARTPDDQIPYPDELDPPITAEDITHAVERLKAGRESGEYTGMREAAERVERLGDQATGGPPVHVGQQAHAAGAAIPFVGWSVWIERAQAIGCGHGCCFAGRQVGS